jgi:DNA-binding NarL/FixJ family response regulator
MGSLSQADERPSSPELTSRQREVLRLLAEGNSMKQVAAVLNLTPRTVAFHKYQMMTQLKIKSTAELIRYAVRHGIV